VELAYVPGAAQLAQVPVAGVVRQCLAGIIEPVVQQFADDFRLGHEAALAQAGCCLSRASRGR
jgi:hypothetical protein